MPAGAGPREIRTYIKYNGNRYILAKAADGKPVYASGTRLLEAVPSDDVVIDLSDMTSGLGHELMSGADVIPVTRNLISMAPQETSYDISAVTGGPVLDSARYSFQAQDSGGRWYLYIISPTAIMKVDVGVDPPVVRRVYDAASVAQIDAQHRFGKPIKAIDQGNVYWIFPCNDGNEILRIDDPVAVDSGAGGADAFTLDTSLTNGAAHFHQLADGRVVLATSSHTTGAAQNRSTIRLLPRGKNFLTETNWSDEWEVANQTDWIIYITSFFNAIAIRKQSGWVRAVILEDDTIEFWDMLPDGYQFFEEADLGAERSINAANLGGVPILTTPDQGLWRWDGFRATPIFPAPNDFDFAKVLANATQQNGYISAVIAKGQWLWGAMNGAGSQPPGVGDSHILAGRMDPGRTIPTWYPVAGAVVDGDIKGVFIQPNGAGGTRLWWPKKAATQDYDLRSIEIGDRGEPFFAGGKYGPDGGTGVMVSKLFLFNSNVIFHECRLVIEHNESTTEWHLWHSTEDDDGVRVEIGFIIATGSIFFQTAPIATRLHRFWLEGEVDRGGAGEYPVDHSPMLHSWMLYGSYLPDVGEAIAATIDIPATARSRKTSVKAIRDEIEALVRDTQHAWVDPYGNAGLAILEDLTKDSPRETWAKEHQTLRLKLIELS